MGEFREMIRQIVQRLDSLEKPTGTQVQQAVKKILELFDTMDEQVAESISRHSYTKAEIDAKKWPTSQITGMLPIGQGGTGSGNAYGQDLASATRRALWVGENGLMGYALSRFDRKTNVQAVELPVAALLGLAAMTFQYRGEDGAAPDEFSGWDLGFVAEDLEALGLEQFLYRSPDGVLEGVAYERLKFVHHEALRQHEERIQDLEAENASMRALISDLTERVTALEPKEQP